MTTEFNNSLTRGFAAVGEPHVAVCLLPGTEVAFEREVECEHIFKVFRSQKLIGEKVARFRQIKMEEPNAHHDVGVRGQIVLLTRLCEGQHATVLQLPALPKTPAETDLKRALPTSAEGRRRTCLKRAGGAGCRLLQGYLRVRG